MSLIESDTLFFTSGMSLELDARTSEEGLSFSLKDGLTTLAKELKTLNEELTHLKKLLENKKRKKKIENETPAKRSKNNK